MSALQGEEVVVNAGQGREQGLPLASGNPREGGLENPLDDGLEPGMEPTPFRTEPHANGTSVFRIARAFDEAAPRETVDHAGDGRSIVARHPGDVAHALIVRVDQDVEEPPLCGGGREPCDSERLLDGVAEHERRAHDARRGTRARIHAGGGFTCGTHIVLYTPK